MSKIKYDSVLNELKSRKKSIKRAELINILEMLGFDVEPGTRGSHYTFVHSGFEVFPAGTFNGEHGKNPLINSVYIISIIRLLGRYEAELREFLGEKI